MEQVAAQPAADIGFTPLLVRQFLKHDPVLSSSSGAHLQTLKTAPNFPFLSLPLIIRSRYRLTCLAFVKFLASITMRLVFALVLSGDSAALVLDAERHNSIAAISRAGFMRLQVFPEIIVAPPFLEILVVMDVELDSKES